MKLRHAAALMLVLVAVSACVEPSYIKDNEAVDRIVANSRNLSQTQQFKVVGTVHTLPINKLGSFSESNCNVRTVARAAYDKFGSEVDAVTDITSTREQLTISNFELVCLAKAIHFGKTPVPAR